MPGCGDHSLLLQGPLLRKPSQQQSEAWPRPRAPRPRLKHLPMESRGQLHPSSGRPGALPASPRAAGGLRGTQARHTVDQF